MPSLFELLLQGLRRASVAPLLAAGMCLVSAGLAHAASGAALAVRDFDETTWPVLLRSGPRPAAYLFTTSYCSTCPDAFAKVAAAAAARQQPVSLVAVMMDVGGTQALRHAAHFPGLTQMYAFDGFEPAIRQSVDPAWPNITPYVVLIDRKGKVQRSIGPPKPAALQAWLKSH